MGTRDHEMNKPDVVLPAQNLHSSRGDQSGRIDHPVNDLILLLLIRNTEVWAVRIDFRRKQSCGS